MGLGIHELLTDKRDEILQLAKQYKAHNVRVFGSVARGEANEESDVDFLVEFEQGTTLVDYVAFMQELEVLLTRKVDVVGEKNLREEIRANVMKDIVPL